MRIWINIIILTFTFSSCKQTVTEAQVKHTQIIPGAEQTELYINKLYNKRIALVVNQTSVIKKTHLVDSLNNIGINITKIFSPEHGYKGKADAGEYIDNQADKSVGAPIVSLYGQKKKPTKEDLNDVDLIVFDIQDVGARFYTYLSTLHYVLESAAENNIPVIVLDRPNPNIDYIDGPVLEDENKSFVGLHPVPIVYGMTIGEYAKMIVGENWINKSESILLSVIPVNNYTRNTIYNLPIKPSPNLPNLVAIKHYPSLCLFEGTTVSVGRGTHFPFQTVGHPDLDTQEFSFTPQSMEGATKPKFNNKQCYGYDLRKVKPIKGHLDLSYIIDTYTQLKEANSSFFLDSNFFDLLAGTNSLREMIINNISEEEIRASWKIDLEKFKIIRNKYLIYD